MFPIPSLAWHDWHVDFSWSRQCYGVLSSSLALLRGWQTGDFGCWWLLSPEPCLMPPFVPQVKWMMYWIVFAFFTTAETLTDIILSW